MKKKIHLHRSVVERLLLKRYSGVPFLAWRSTIKRDRVNTPQCVVDRRTRYDSLIRRTKGSFAVSWPTQLGEYHKITQIIGHWWALEAGFKGPVLPLLNSSKRRVTRSKDLVAIFCRAHFVFSFQLFFGSIVTFRLQRWSPWGHILKFLASKPQVLKNCPVLGSRRALFFKSFKFCRSPEKIFCRPCFSEITKNFFEDLFFEIAWKTFLKTLLFFSFENRCVRGLEHYCPWPREGLASEGLSLASDFFCPWPRALCPRLHLSPFKPNFEPLSPFSHINFYINFI